MLKGIAYYKHLRQLTNRNRNQKQLEMDQMKDHLHHDDWTNFFARSAFVPSHHLISPSSQPVSLSNNGMHDMSSHPGAIHTISPQPLQQHQHQQQRQQHEAVSGKSMPLSVATADNFTRQQQQSGTLPTSKLAFNGFSQSPASNQVIDKTQMMVKLPQQPNKSTMKSIKHAKRENSQLLILPGIKNQQQQSSTIRLESTRTPKPRSRQQFKSSSTNVFMVNGMRAHPMTTNETDHHFEIVSRENEEDEMKEQEQQQHVISTTTLPTGLSFRKLDDELEDSENNIIFANSEKNLLDEVMQVSKKATETKTKRRQDELFNTVRSNGTVYTLMSASQLDKLSKKLSKSNGRNTINHQALNNNNNNNKYRLVHTVAPKQRLVNEAPSTSSGKRDSGLANDFSSSQSSSSSSSSSLSSSTSSSSSSSSGPHSDINSTSCGPDIESDISIPKTKHHSTKLDRKHARLLGLRQTEEQLVSASSIKGTTSSSKHNNHSRKSSIQDINFSLGKCK